MKEIPHSWVACFSISLLKLKCFSNICPKLSLLEIMLIPPLSSSTDDEEQSIILLFLEVPASWKTLVTFIPQFPLLQTKQHPSLYPPLRWQIQNWPLGRFLCCQKCVQPLVVSPELSRFTLLELLADLVLRLRGSKAGVGGGGTLHLIWLES